MNTLIEKEDYPQLPSLQQARHVELGRTVFRIAERTHEKKDRVLKDHPQVNNEDIRRDFRYLLGYIEALHDIMTLPEQATKLLTQGG